MYVKNTLHEIAILFVVFTDVMGQRYIGMLVILFIAINVMIYSYSVQCLYNFNVKINKTQNLRANHIHFPIVSRIHKYKCIIKMVT